MASPSNNPFYGSGAGNTPGNIGYQRLALDNLLRRELKVSDPGDPQQIANALMERFRDDPRTNAITQEARGLPFLQSAALPALPVQAATSSSAELQQAKDDVERDLQELTTNSLLKDVTPEIQGWAQAVRSAIAEGTTAARFALDTRQRDKAFAIRRQLGDYARLARLVGALTPTLSLTYRKFAQSLDEIAAVLLVMMGEALSNVGFAGGRFLLQAPYTELQVRRDAAIYALRNLVGATQLAYDQNSWPRGLDAYRRLFDALEAQGQGDLRALLVEVELARTMDELIQRAAHGTADGLRALGSTAQLDLERFRRLVIVGQRVVTPESPPLTAFLEALALFADAFDSSGGFRLMRIARPPILFYGLYGTSGLDDAEQRLLRLVIARGLLADQLDCFMSCACTDAVVKCQIILDKILYDVDRAIDLYAVGKEDFGQPERRAAAYSYVIDFFVNTFQFAVKNRDGTTTISTCDLSLSSQIPGKTLQDTLVDIRQQLRPELRLSNVEVARVVEDLFLTSEELLIKLQENSLCGSAGSTGATICKGLDRAAAGSECNQLVAKTLTAAGAIDPTKRISVSDLTPLFGRIQQAQARLRQNQISFRSHAVINSFLSILQQELCIQKDAESRWENLVQTMAPDCIPFPDIFDAISQVIDGAITQVSRVECAPFEPTIPPHYETSLDGIADDVDRIGSNRPTNIA